MPYRNTKPRATRPRPSSTTLSSDRPVNGSVDPLGVEDCVVCGFGAADAGVRGGFAVGGVRGALGDRGVAAGAGGVDFGEGVGVGVGIGVGVGVVAGKLAAGASGVAPGTAGVTTCGIGVTDPGGCGGVNTCCCRYWSSAAVIGSAASATPAVEAHAKTTATSSVAGKRLALRIRPRVMLTKRPKGDSNRSCPDTSVRLPIPVENNQVSGNLGGRWS